MKNSTFIKRCKYLIFAGIVLAAFSTACVVFKSINQPETASTNSSFDVTIQLVKDDGSDYNNDNLADNFANVGLFGVLLPKGWTIDEDEFEVQKYATATHETWNRTVWVYSDKDQSDALQAASPAPKGYYWWGGISDMLDMRHLDYIEFTIKILTNDEEGTFNLRYAVGDMDYADRIPFDTNCFSANIPITVSENSGTADLSVAGIKVYPTVTRNFITVKTPDFADYSIKVFSLSGKLLSKQQSEGASTIVNLSEFGAGTYLVSVQGAGSVKNFKVIASK
jgi:hypothetical protein